MEVRMRLGRVMLSMGLLGITTAGCASVAEVQCDQDKIHRALVELYKEQVTNNLILAFNGLPFIQVDYSNATSTVTISESGSLGGSQQSNLSDPLNKAARLASVARLFQNIWSYSAGATNSNQIAVTANPVITSPEIYDAYLEFLGLPGSLQVSSDPPPDSEKHVCKKWGGKYYWVPIEYRTEFLRLALLTTAQRGKRLLAAPAYFTISLTGVLDDKTTAMEKRAGTFALTMQLDREVPNDDGNITVDIGDKKGATLVVRKFTDGNFEPTVTRKLVVVFNPNRVPTLKIPTDVNKILPIDCKLKLDHFQPEAPLTDELLQNVRFQLEQIRFNQLRP
jgi:hypothetical protein